MTNKFEMPESSIAEAIENAEVANDPLANIVERTRRDAGAPFEPHVLDALSKLLRENPRAYEAKRRDLKYAGCRVSKLDKAVANCSGKSSTPDTAQSDILIELAKSANVFHAPDGTGYADIRIGSHRETWPINSKAIRGWLRHEYYKKTGRPPTREAITSAIGHVEAVAQFDSPERSVYIRVGELDGRLYIDLCDESWQAIEIDSSGWRVVDDPPIRFRRTRGMKALPVPEAGGSIESLPSFLNVQTNEHFVLVVAWIIACFRPTGPYPVLAITGEQGSAKSTFARILKALVDPSIPPNRSLPRDERDLFIAANNGFILPFDNISDLSAWFSDAICRLATGGGFATRQLCTDLDEVLFDGVRPVILNGIENFISRPDLAETGYSCGAAGHPRQASTTRV
jgi:hypothetical protein